MGNHKTKCRNRLRSCAVREWMFLLLVCSLSAALWLCCQSKEVDMKLSAFFYSVAKFIKITIIVGIKSADRNELAQVSSKPSRDFTSFVGDFKLLNTLLPIVKTQICSVVGGVYASDGMYGCHISTTLFLIYSLLQMC